MVIISIILTQELTNRSQIYQWNTIKSPETDSHIHGNFSIWLRHHWRLTRYTTGENNLRPPTSYHTKRNFIQTTNIK